MDDLISREDAIRWVKTECNPYGKPTLDFESGKKVIEHLEQMPFAQPEPHWIPCSERMPKQNGFYLLSSSGTVLIAYYSDGEWLSELPLIMTENNTAWMPLPEPYKEGQNG